MSKRTKAFTDIFIQKPVLAIVVNLLIIIAGIQAVYTATQGKGDFSMRQYPRSDNSSITITTVYVGASAELVRGFITTPIERVVAAAEGIDYIESKSTLGLSTITARLKLNFDATRALADISSKVDQVRADLPPEAEVPIINITSADTKHAVAYLSFASESMKTNEVTDYLARVVQPALTAIPGIQKADILGAQTYAMRIWLKQDQLIAYNLSANDIATALRSNNALAALGNTNGQYVKVSITADTHLKTPEEFRQLVVAKRGGAIIRLEDVADVQLGAENYNTDIRFDGKEAVFMGIWVMPTANTLDVIAAARDKMNLLRERFPSGFEGHIAYDATEYIDSSISEVIITLLETLFIVIVVIFLFLGSPRSVILPVVVIPISLIGGVFLMQIFGFSINLLTLLAIVLAVGLVVDDAIVVVENVDRHLSMGKDPFNAAILGARELIGPIIATTITLVAVYLPVAFQGGLTGSLFREFSITLAGALVVSSIVALTLSPMMASQIMKSGQSEQGLSRFVNHIFDKLKITYSKMIASTLRTRTSVYAVWILLSIGCLPLFIFSSMTNELAPTEDQGIIFGALSSASNNTIDQSKHYAKQIQDIYESAPEYAYSFQITNATDGLSGMLTVPWDQRDRHIIDIRMELLPQFMSLAGARIFPILPAALPGASNFPVEFIITSTSDVDEIYNIAKTVSAKAAASGMFAFPPELDIKFDEPQTIVSINKERVADLGLNVKQVTDELSTLIGDNYINRFSIDGRSYKVIPQVKRSSRLTPDKLEELYIRGTEDELIPLSSIASLEQQTVPRTLNRFNQLNAVKLSAIPQGPLDSVLKVLENETAKIMPKGYAMDYAGESRQLRVEGSRFIPTLGMALILIFLVLAAQFNSFRDPLIILLGSVPLGLFGALLFIALRAPGDPWTPHWSWGWTTTWNIYSQVGIITLIGLVTKNSILIVEFANVQQQKGMNKIEAVREAAATRLRPILMTTAATVFGHMMLVFVSGPGAAARNSIGIVLVCGMTIGTIFTLFIVPSIYVLFAKEQNKHKQEAPA